MKHINIPGKPGVNIIQESAQTLFTHMLIRVVSYPNKRQRKKLRMTHCVKTDKLENKLKTPLRRHHTILNCYVLKSRG